MNFGIKNILFFWIIPVIFLGFWYFRQPLLAFIAGLLFGFVVQTIALYLNYKLKLNYYLNVFLIYLFFIVLVITIFYLTFDVLTEELPKLFHIFQKLKPFLEEYNLNQIYLKDKWQNFLFSNSVKLSEFLGFIYDFLGGFFSLILIFVVSIYTALQRQLPQQVFKIFPREKRENYEKIWRMIKRKISFWFLGQIILMFFIGFFSYLFVGPILKINYALLIGFLAGLLEIIPIFGPAFTAFFASVITFLDKPELTFIVIGYFILLQQIENHLLVPIVMKKATNINPLLIILGMLIGAKIGGVLGIIIILPLLGIVVELINLAGSSNGRTPPSGGGDPGSSPGPADK